MGMEKVQNRATEMITGLVSFFSFLSFFTTFNCSILNATNVLSMTALIGLFHFLTRKEYSLEKVFLQSRKKAPEGGDD